MFCRLFAPMPRINRSAMKPKIKPCEPSSWLIFALRPFMIHRGDAWKAGSGGGGGGGGFLGPEREEPRVRGLHHGAPSIRRGEPSQGVWTRGNCIAGRSLQSNAFSGIAHMARRTKQGGARHRQCSASLVIFRHFHVLWLRTLVKYCLLSCWDCHQPDESGRPRSDGRASLWFFTRTLQVDCYLSRCCDGAVVPVATADVLVVILATNVMDQRLALGCGAKINGT